MEDFDDITVEITEEVPITLEITQDVDTITLDLNSQVLNGTNSQVYIHTQTSSSSTWTINHNLGFKPIVQVFNSGSQLITSQITHMSNNQVVVNLTSSITGFARLL